MPERIGCVYAIAGRVLRAEDGRSSREDLVDLTLDCLDPRADLTLFWKGAYGVPA